MVLTTKFSIFHPFEIVASGGYLVRQVDTNGVALDDGVTTFSTAQPVLSVNSQGRSPDMSRAYGSWGKVTLSDKGRPVVRVDSTGTAINTPFTVPTNFRTGAGNKSLAPVTLVSNNL